MKKGYENREMRTEREEEIAPAPFEDEMMFFFPKNNPPVSIKAKTIEEAEEQLAARNKKEV